MVNRKHDIIELDCIIKHETEKAYLVETDMGEAWVAKSICEYDGETLQLPEWLAIEKELV